MNTKLDSIDRTERAIEYMHMAARQAHLSGNEALEADIDTVISLAEDDINTEYVNNGPIVEKR